MRLVFVSSTFKDMQFERDELKNRVAPRIDSFLASYGENVHFGDLRWGVNTTKMSEEESAKKVLKVCLDEIDDCRPYMIVFIGERYGWIPSQELILEAAKIRGIEDIDPDISVTNLEIEYGALLNPDFEGHILFYFRNLDTSEMDIEDKKIYEAESDIHKQKLDALKKTIEEKYPGYVRYYDAKYDKKTKTIVNLSPVMEMVYNDLCHIFKIDLDKFESLPNYQRAIINSKTRFEKYYKNAYRRTDFDYSLGEWDVLDNYIDNKYKNIPTMFNVFGEAGSGKKTNLAIMYEDSLKNKDNPSYPFVVGLDEYTKGADELAEFMIRIIEDHLHIEHKKYFEYGLSHELASLVLELDKTNTHIRFFVMNCTKEVMNMFRTLEASLDSKITNVSFYIEFEQETIHDNYPVPFWLCSKSLPSGEDLELSLENKNGIIRAILKSKHKELPESVIKLIATKEGSNNALYLSLIIERLLLLDHQDFQNIRNLGDGMIAIEKYMSLIVNNSGNNISAIAKELLKELKERINPEMIPIVLKLLTYDIYLTNRDIEHFFNFMSLAWNEVDYSLFVHSIPSLFKDSSLASPCLEFKIREIKDAARELVDEWGVKDYSNDVIRYLESLEEEDIKKDVRLFEAYRYFNQAEKSASLYLEAIKKIPIKEQITAYEKEVFKKLETEFESYRNYYIEVYKKVIDCIDEGKVDNIGHLCTYFYQIFDVHLINAEVKESWAYMVVELIGYMYNKHIKNKDNDELFFILMMSLDSVNYYFSNGNFINEISSDFKYLKSYEKASSLLKKKTNKDRFELLQNIYEQDGFNVFYTNEYLVKGLIANLIESMISRSDMTDYVKDNNDLINYFYGIYFEQENETIQELITKEKPDTQTLKDDNGMSLFVLAAKLIALIEDEDLEQALEVFKLYSHILLKYRDKFYFFTNGNIGLFLLSNIVVDFLIYLRLIYISACWESELEDEFEKLYMSDLEAVLGLMKVYLPDHYQDLSALKNYMDILNNILAQDDKKVHEEEYILDYAFISNIAENWAILQPHTEDVFKSLIVLKSRFINILFKNIGIVNDDFISDLYIMYWKNMYDDEDADNYTILLNIIATYLFVTEQDKNYNLYKVIYKKFISDAFEVTYKDFKEGIKYEILKIEAAKAGLILDAIDDEEGFEWDED